MLIFIYKQLNNRLIILIRRKEMKKTFVLDDLDCANCAAKIENAIREIEGVVSASVSFMTGKLVLEAEEERFEEILDAAEKLIAKVDSDVTLVR